MMRWKVMLPKEKSLWLESDTPHEALEKLGYAGQRRSGGRLCYNDGAQPETAGPHTV